MSIVILEDVINRGISTLEFFIEFDESSFYDRF